MGKFCAGMTLKRLFNALSPDLRARLIKDTGSPGRFDSELELVRHTFDVWRYIHERGGLVDTASGSCRGWLLPYRRRSRVSRTIRRAKNRSSRHLRPLPAGRTDRMTTTLSTTDYARMQKLTDTASQRGWFVTDQLIGSGGGADVLLAV